MIEIEEGYKNSLPAVSSAMQRTVMPSVRLTWKMYRSCEYDTWLSSLPGIFSRIWRAIAPALDWGTALNSASTTDPLATSAYCIAIGGQDLLDSFSISSFSLLI